MKLRFVSFGVGPERIAFKVGQDNVISITKAAKLFTIHMKIDGEDTLAGETLTWVISTDKYPAYTYVQ